MTSLLGALGRALPRGRLVRRVAVLAGGTATAQVLMLMSMPLLTRLYTPAEMGVLTAFVSILSLIAVVGGLCYEQAIPLPADDADAAHLVVLSLALYAGVALLVLLGLFVAGDHVARWANNPGLLPFLGLLPLSLVMLGLHQNMTYWAIRTKAFTSVAQAKLGQAVGQIGAQVGLGLLQVGGLGLLVGDVLGRTSGAGTAVLLGWPRARRAFAALRLAELGRVGWRYRKFSLGVVPGFMSAANTQAPIFVIAACFGPPSMAAYALAQQVIATPLGLLGEATGQAFMAEAAGATDPGAVKARLRSLMAKMAMAGAMLMVAVVIGAPAFFALVFGESWREAGVIVQFLVPVFVVRFVLCPIDTTVRVIERQEVIVLREVVRSIILAGAILLALQLPGGLHTMMAVLSVALVLAYVSYGFIGWHTISRHWRGPGGSLPGTPFER